MSNFIREELCFSEPFLRVEYLRNVFDLKITGNCILINLDKNILNFESNSLGRFESGVFYNIKILELSEALLIYSKGDFFSFDPYRYSETIKDKWEHIYKIFPYEDLKDVKLWRSPKERIGNIEYNLWYAPEKTHCSIHKEHNFYEIHTQIYGIGCMQKFYENNYNSLYQTTGMLPGTSHKRFCNDKFEYPWHQYLSETDCIWLVMEEYKK